MTHLDLQADALLDLADGRLNDVAAAALRQHLDDCPECRAALAALETARLAAAELRPARPVPSVLASAIERGLDQVDRPPAQTDATRTTSRLASRRLLIWRAAIGLAAVGVLFLFWLRPTSELARAAMRESRAAIASDYALEFQTSDPAELERRLNAPGRPRVRVIDLAMMGYTVIGGRHRTVAGRPAVLYVYRGKDGVRLVCQMFPGSLVEMRFTADVRQRDRFTFRVYTAGDHTSVFWQEGDLVCVLSGEIPKEALVALAMAKAMAP